ncbi:MAG: hypothetical protein JWN98_1897, partial [Abditibacteriota bacterium]|nr:hypothetical protein [Abditibacteriota bacterium]
MNGNSMSERDLNSKWIDFYALLGLPEDADKETVRKTIGASYADASANADHRDLQRRHYFQTMVERVLPQCRRVLLDPDLRAAYDAQNARHRAGDEGALDYVSFMAALQSGNLAALTDGGISSEWDELPEKVRDEIDLARSVVECVEAGSEFDIIPARALTSSGPASEATSTTYSATPSSTESTPLAPTIQSTLQSTDAPTAIGSIAEASAEAAMPVASQPIIVEAKAPQASIPQPVAPQATAAGVTAGSSSAGNGPTIRERYEAAASAAIADTTSYKSSGNKSNSKAKPQNYKSRLSIGDEEERQSRARSGANSHGRQGKSVLTPLATHILTGIVSAALIMTIFQFTDNPTAAGDRLPLTVVYASELQPIMEQSEQLFEASPDGTGIDVILQATDSR